MNCNTTKMLGSWYYEMLQRIFIFGFSHFLRRTQEQCIFGLWLQKVLVLRRSKSSSTTCPSRSRDNASANRFVSTSSDFVRKLNLSSQYALRVCQSVPIGVSSNIITIIVSLIDFFWCACTFLFLSGLWFDQCFTTYIANKLSACELHPSEQRSQEFLV